MPSRWRHILSSRRRRRQILPPAWRRHPVIYAVFALIVIVGVLARRSPEPDGAPLGDYERYHGRTFRVAKVVDGDTVDLDAPDGEKRTTRVRLWGVDTPEVHTPGEPPMHYGPEASDFAKRHLAGREVETLLVEGETRGKYGRLLAYLRLPGEETTFNERLIVTGHGYADWRFDHPYKERFLEAERKARRQEIGLWAEVTPGKMPGWRRRRASDAGRASLRPVLSVLEGVR